MSAACDLTVLLPGMGNGVLRVWGPLLRHPGLRASGVLWVLQEVDLGFSASRVLPPTDGGAYALPACF